MTVAPQLLQCDTYVLRLNRMSQELGCELSIVRNGGLLETSSKIVAHGKLSLVRLDFHERQISDLTLMPGGYRWMNLGEDHIVFAHAAKWQVYFDAVGKPPPSKLAELVPNRMWPLFVELDHRYAPIPALHGEILRCKPSYHTATW